VNSLFSAPIAQPQEQAAVFHFLAANDSSYLTGQTINVDGGWLNGLTYQKIEKLLD
jgi:NAD(P)-dependent dehydrogenase (short-subunit alcohol dehydrogenase family)